MGGIYLSLKHGIRRFHVLVPRYEGHVSLASDFIHACYQANGIVVLVISDPLESALAPPLEAVHNKLKDCLFNFGKYFAG